MEAPRRRALVTGAGRGLGRATALALAQSGMAVALVARTSSQLESTAAEARAFGVRALAITADVGSADDMRRARDAVNAEFGGVDVVVNNAGQLLFKPLIPVPGSTVDNPDFQTPTTDDEWHAIMRTHVDGAFHVVREFVPGMLDRGYGRVVNVTSNVIGRAVPFTSAYHVAKGALVAMTRSLAVEWARYGVTVNAVAAGHFPTDMSAAQFEDERLHAWMMKRIPMRRGGEPAELASLVCYLASEHAGYITGEVVTIDGGETL